MALKTVSYVVRRMRTSTHDARAALAAEPGPDVIVPRLEALTK
ncbi:hypothetical protein [Streptomyces sp. CA-179760]